MHTEMSKSIISNLEEGHLPLDERGIKCAACYRSMYYNSSNVSKLYLNYKKYGYSVRCVKNPDFK